MAEALQVGAKTELTGDAAEQRTGCEVDRRRRWQRLPVRIAVEVRKPVTREGLGIAVDGIVVKHAHYFGHDLDYLS